jgi:hypothetical protein
LARPNNCFARNSTLLPGTRPKAFSHKKWVIFSINHYLRDS